MKSISIDIVVHDRCQASSVFLIIDLILAANFAAKKYLKVVEPLFHYQLIGLKKTAVAYNGAEIKSIKKIRDSKKPDIVVIPGIFEAVLAYDKSQKYLEAMLPLLSKLKTWHQEGCIIASVCTGNYLLASAKISSGRSLTCHWSSQDTAKKLFPHENFETNKLLIDHGDIVSAGGAMAVSQLVLYLISRCHSRELSLLTGKLMMVDFNIEGQSRFAVFKPKIVQNDKLVAKLQCHIEREFSEKTDIFQFASKEGISERQLYRRFKTATGETPLTYLQRYRVERVKLSLESKNLPFDSLIRDVGYEDMASFRRLFKRFTGLTMLEYRNRFSYERYGNL